MNDLSAYWNSSTSELFAGLTCTENGLSDEEAAARLKTFGPNTIKSNVRTSAFLLFLSQFKSPITLLLIGAALLSAGLGDTADTTIILIIVLISGALGFWQERGAANAVNELLKMVQVHCDVLR